MRLRGKIEHADERRQWLGAAGVYARPRVLAFLFLGFSSGLPLALTAGTLAIWLTEAGVSDNSTARTFCGEEGGVVSAGSSEAVAAPYHAAATATAAKPSGHLPAGRQPGEAR